jgi:tetratricopeptide (TPR) repeat protein
MTERLAKLTTFLENAPDDPFILFAIAKEHEQQGNLATALDYYQKVRIVDNQYVGVYYHLGKLLEKLEQPDAALAAYDQGMAVATSIGDRHALSELAAARLELAD